MEPIVRIFFDVETGVIEEHELTQEEIDALFKSDPLSPDA